MKIYLRLEAPYEWVRISGQKVEAFGEVAELSEYPVAEDDFVIGVVPGEWVTTHRISLPAKSKKQFNLALPYALEESVSEEIENMHFVCADWKAGEECNVLAVSKAKMTQWQSLATENELAVQQLVPDHALLPFHESAECSLALSDGQVLANHRTGHGVNIDSDLLEAWVMDIPMNAIIAVNDASLTDQLIKEYPDRDFRHWPFGAKMAHWLEYLPSTNIDLWADAFRPRFRTAGDRRFALPLILVAIAVVMKMGYDSYRYISLKSEIASIGSESQQILQETFPAFDSVKPGTERKLMTQALSRHSSADNSKSLQSVLAQTAGILRNQNVVITDLVYRNDELVITCLLGDFSQVDTLTNQLNARPEISAALQSSAAEDGKIVASYSLKQS